MKKKAFTLIELLVVVAIIALLISILLPSLSRARELSKRLVCASNAKGMGTSFKIYSNDNQEHWPTPTFSETTTNQIQYTEGVVPVGFGNTETGAKPGRRVISSNLTTTLSVTRALYMLVRSGDVTPKQFICPSSGDSVDTDQNIDLFYDFRGKKYVSYGYQVPYGPFSTRGSEDVDPRMAVAADKGPYYENGAGGSGEALPQNDPSWGTGGDGMTPQAWQKYNSPNHGGKNSGEGQNVLFGDGHATFEKSPDVGIDEDNIYTRMTDMTGDAASVNNARKSGAFPANIYPGYQSLNTAGLGDSTTDSLIYP